MNTDVKTNSKPVTSERKQAVSRRSFRQAIKIVSALPTGQAPHWADLMCLYQNARPESALKRVLGNAAEIRDIMSANDTDDGLVWAALLLAVSMHEDDGGQ